ncbi:PD-(D/E)XK nuclease family protein [Runella sp.]|uniref:PD-(D/E)XK nuclease family protein n=1 Tax=Runella sp. TaxID=1960881 RepID=UPI003D0A8209
MLIIVPTRRAAYFFKRALAQCSDRPFLAPEVLSFDDFVTKKCGVEMADDVSLLFELYDVFKQVDKHITFERYLQWGSMLLRDFDAIDQYLDADRTNYLFDYITEAKAIERWELDWPKNKISSDSERIKAYFELFSNLREVYERFRQHLQAKKRVYRGLAYRILAENTFEFLLNNDAEAVPNANEETETSSNSAPDFYFVGLSALSAAQEKIVRTLIKAKRAEILWDTDHYYMRENPYIEGGKALRAYRDAAWAGQWKWTENQLLQTPKDITVYAVPNASMQAKVAGELYRQWGVEDLGGTEDRPVAIVLADENLLVPVLNGLDETIVDLNVTMGLTLRNSLLFTLVDSLFELQFTVAEFKAKDGRAIKIPKYNHRTVQKVLNHPFIRRYEFLALQDRNSTAPSIIQTTIHEIQRRNFVYLDPNQLLEWGENHPLFVSLFSRWDDNPHTVIKAMYVLIDLLREVYKDTQNAIETEYLYLFYTLLKQLETTLNNSRAEKLNLRTFKAFMYELIRQTRIPFSGEPVSPLQIMGMLETQALDFERIIILSMNEGVFPAAKRQNSMIPWDIAKEAGLPIYRDQDAVMSYHFYRLLQRAKDVHLVYVTDPNTYNGGEKSRFIRQLEHELADKAKDTIRYKELTVMFKEKEKSAEEAESENRLDPLTIENLVEGHKLKIARQKAANTDWTVPKTPETLAFLISSLEKDGLYATHLNQYLKCSLQYYFNRIAGVAEDEEVEDRIGSADFGSWIHKVLERIDKEFLMEGKPITDEQVKAILREEFDKQFGGYDAESGINRLLYQVAEQTVVDFLREQRTRNESLVVLATERKLSATLSFQVGDKTILFKVGGKIDRIELVDNMIRVADYKTGKIDQLPKVTPDKLADIMNSGTNPNYEKIRQLWIYQYLIYKQMLHDQGLMLRGQLFHLDNYQVTSGFYSLRNIKRGFIENPLQFDQANDPESYVAQSEEYIRAFITEKLLNVDEPFRKTDQLIGCQYCDYKEICGR